MMKLWNILVKILMFLCRRKKSEYSRNFARRNGWTFLAVFFRARFLCKFVFFSLGLACPLPPFRFPFISVLQTYTQNGKETDTRKTQDESKTRIQFGFPFGSLFFKPAVPGFLEHFLSATICMHSINKGKPKKGPSELEQLKQTNFPARFFFGHFSMKPLQRLECV